jgi:hypothetical protein
MSAARTVGLVVTVLGIALGVIVADPAEPPITRPAPAVRVVVLATEWVPSVTVREPPPELAEQSRCAASVLAVIRTEVPGAMLEHVPAGVSVVELVNVTAPVL